MSDPVARALRLLGHLQRRAYWPGPELAEALQITPRTLRRDIERLRSLGYAIESDRGVGGGYALSSGRRMPPLVLDDEALAAIVLGLRAAVGSSIVGIESVALDALTRLEAVLPARLRERVGEMSASVVWAVERAEARVELTTLLALSQAHRVGRCARFGYTSARGDETRREVEVSHIVPDGRRWYLVAWDLGRDDWRTFRLDRIDEVSIADRPVSREHTLEAEEARARVQTGCWRGAVHTAVLRIDGPVAWIRACVSWLRHEIVEDADGDGFTQLTLYDEVPNKIAAAIAALTSDPSLEIVAATLDPEVERARQALCQRLGALGHIPSA